MSDQALVEELGQSAKENSNTEAVEQESQEEVTKTKTRRKRKTKSSQEKGEDGKGATLSKGKRNAELGRRGEDAAARFLYRRGYEILERNWTCVAGEADIIARDENALVFVEVKTRSSLDKGFPSEAVDAAKRSRYERIAALFLQGYNVVDISVRFDVVSLVALSSERAMIRHHINAFAAG